MTFISGLICPRDHQKPAVNGGLPLKAAPLTQVNLALKKPMKIWDLSILTIIGGSPLMPGPKEPGLYCMCFFRGTLQQQQKKGIDLLFHNISPVILNILAAKV